MALNRWEPFEGLSSLRREMDRLFENFFERSPLAAIGGGQEPAVEVVDTHENVTVKVQVPGVKRENLQIDITDDALTLKGEMPEEEAQTTEKRYYRREFRYGAFTRTIPLPANVHADQASAQLKDGVLTITLPKSAQSRARQIPIQAAEGSAQPRGDGARSPEGQAQNT